MKRQPSREKLEYEAHIYLTAAEQKIIHKLAEENTRSFNAQLRHMIKLAVAKIGK